MTHQLSEIGGRLAALRDIMEITAEKMAENMKLGVDEYIAYENGQLDFSFSFLQNAANILGVDVVDIISGESPKLTKCTLVRKGGGYDIIRRKAYDYKHLAFTFSNKKAEPFMVTVVPEPKSENLEKSKESEKSAESKLTNLTMHSHEGQEFNYMVSGSMKFYLDTTVYELNEGDSVYFDSSIPHAMKALGDQPAKFIAVVIK